MTNETKIEFKTEVFNRLKDLLYGYIDVHFDDKYPDNLIVYVNPKQSDIYFKKTWIHATDYIENGGTAEDMVDHVVQQYKNYIFGRYFAKKQYDKEQLKTIPIQDPGGYYPSEPLKMEDIVSFEATEET